MKLRTTGHTVNYRILRLPVVFLGFFKTTTKQQEDQESCLLYGQSNRDFSSWKVAKSSHLSMESWKVITQNAPIYKDKLRVLKETN